MATPSQGKGKGLANSPPLLPTEFLTPSPPTTAPHVPRPVKPSSRDLGVTGPPIRTSQNEDRLPKAPSQQSSDSSGSGPRGLSGSQLPSLDESPAGYPVGHVYTQSSSGSSQSGSQTARYARHHVESESQSINVISFQSLGSSESAPDVSVLHSYSFHGSDESGRTNSSFGTNASGHSSISMSSDMSFNVQDTSTPRELPTQPEPSQISTSSDSERSSLSQQLLSPPRIIEYSQQETLEIESQEAGPSGSAPLPTNPDNNEQKALDDSSQATEVFGTDPSHEEIDAAFASQSEGQNEENVAREVIELDDDDEVIPGTMESIGGSERSDVIRGSVFSQDVVETVGSTPPSVIVRKRERSTLTQELSQDSSGHDFEYATSDEDEASRSTLGNKFDIELHMSQSQASIALSLPRRTSEDVSSASLSESASLASLSTGNILPSSSSAHPTMTSTTDTPTDLISTKTEDNTEESGPTVQHQGSIGSDHPGSRHSSPPASQSSTPQRQVRSRRSTRLTGSSSQDIPSSQSSNLPHQPSGSFMSRLASASDTETDPVLPAVPKRRRVKPEPDVSQMASSAEAQGFWEGSEATGPESPQLRERSRSKSRDITSFPEDDLGSLGPEPGDDSSPEDGPPSPTTRSRVGSSSPTSKVPPPPRGSSARETRRQGSSQSLEPVSPSRRNLRRAQTTTGALRTYKVNDAVWALWRKLYYAGVVSRKDRTRYDVRFLDGEAGSCNSSDMRPLKLRLGAQVMANGPDVKEQPAVVEGVHMAADPAQSRVDVRFKDHVEANLPLVDISLTIDMMVDLDKDMDWEETPSYGEPIPPPIAESSSSSSRQPAPPSTPRKSRAKSATAERGVSVSMTPTRRSRAESQQTSSRTGRDMFKDMSFVLSLSSTKTKELDRDIPSKIKAGGGIILDNFSSVVGMPRPRSSDVFLISYSMLRTEKYLEALALNVPRVSYRWIEYCSEQRQLFPYQPYLLPTGISRELDTTVSSVPVNDQGVFHGLQIGLCGLSSGRDQWERLVKSAGANTVTITPKSGPKNCNYIVFFSSRIHQQYCGVNTEVPPLAKEWIVQCLINQRVVSINGHPSYTDLTEGAAAGTTTTGTAATTTSASSSGGDTSSPAT
ncbi:hypothetical protein B0O80DRAFT_444499 [Mortierella sp. GBAus27b]|nr:hypothetical protein BGX31_004447 [Mortierella sp. GBA43]KAI8358323.1 hypothetical protein B0O80DRAFT_444499 [Mortierella sp. GBAus27b]